MLPNIKPLLLILCLPFGIFAQKPIPKNLAAFDEKWIHFGFTLGMNTADYIIQYDLKRVDSLLGIEVQQQNGFNLGIISDLHLTQLISLRFVPSLLFTQRNIEYSFLNRKGERELLSKDVESTYIDFPFHLKYRSERQNNFACYLLAGGKYSIDLASRAHVDNALNSKQDIVIKLQKQSVSYEAGFGMDFFMRYFKFSPEIKLGIGVNNVFINDHTIFSEPIDVIKSKMILISFNFEG